MYSEQFQQIRQLTYSIAEAVEILQIDECNKLLQVRQAILEEIYQSLIGNSNKAAQQEFVTLLKWLEVTDKIPLEQSNALKNEYKKKLSKQKKTKYAIKQYNSMT